MSEIKSLKHRVSQISVYSFVCMSVVMFFCFWAYSVKKNKIAEAQIKKELSLNLKNQTNQFLPSYLLPEQKMGMDLMLSKIKSDESLEDIRILSSQTDIPSSYTDCRLDETNTVTCSTRNFAVTAVITPLRDADKIYGYFFKARKNSSAGAVVEAAQFALAAIVLIGLAFASIYFRLRNLTAKQLPQSMDLLAKWIEAEIEGRSIECDSLQFIELEDLKSKISEVIDRANKSRDQAVIGQVTSGIMHDIKTPLQSIVTAVHLVDEQRENQDKRMRRLENLFNMCVANIPLIGQIIEATLDGNRDIQIVKTQSNLRETLETSLQNTRDLSLRSGVSVEINTPDEVMAKFDQIQLLRVINNLLKNGIEAAAEKHELKKVRVSLMELENRVKLVIEDSGPGFKVSPNKVFRAFRTTKERGTGLGLLISKKIVEAHSGEILVSNQSALGGAKMEVVLPS